MIGRLTGILKEKQAPHILLEVGGVGYEIQVPMTTLYELPDIGDSTTMYTHFVVREDAQLLYGFHRQQERRLFRELIKVNGVGPKMGLAILSGMDADSFVRAVRLEDSQTLLLLPGIGKRIAERLLVEMRDRLEGWAIETGAEVTPKSAGQRQMLAEAESALVALGYRPTEASRALSAVEHEGLDSVEEWIRLALQSMVKN